MNVHMSLRQPLPQIKSNVVLWLSVVGPILGVIGVVAASAYVLFADVAKTQDEAYMQTTTQLVERSLKGKITELDKLADDNAEWDTGYQYSSISWDQKGIEDSYYSDFSEGVSVVGQDGAVRYLSTFGLSIPMAAEVAKLESDGFLSRAVKNHVASLGHASGSKNELVNLNDGLVVLTTSIIRPSGKTDLKVHPTDQRYFYVLATMITANRLVEMANRIGLERLTYVAGTKRPTFAKPMITFALKNDRNAIVGWLVWPRKMPGTAAFESRKLSIGIGLLLIGCLAIFVSAQLVSRQVRAHKEARRLAEDASRMKSQFLANMSHELRTPLNAVIGYAEIIAEDSDISGAKETAKDAKKISRAAQHLLSLINSVLDHAKLEAGKIELTIDDVALTDVFNEVVEVIQKTASDNGNVLVLNCDPDIGSAQIDRLRLKQSVLNLVSNGVKFTSNGKITIAARGVNLDGVACIRISISDTGIGMSEEVLSRLFQPFEQANGSTTREFGGTGLGLSITKQLVEAMGGRVDVSSEAGVGSVFTLILPRGACNATQAAPDDPKLAIAA